MEVIYSEFWDALLFAGISLSSSMQNLVYKFKTETASSEVSHYDMKYTDTIL